MNTTKYMQTDSRWSELGYPKYPCTIGNSGCGEVSVCNCIIEMQKYANYTPKTIQPYCKQYSASNCDGTYWSGIPKMMAHYGLTEVKEHDTMPSLFKELAKGNRVAIYLMGSRRGGSKGIHWTSGGHFVCSTAYKFKDGKNYVYVKDSYSNSKDRNGWISYEENMKGDVSAVWSGKLTGKLTDGTTASDVKGTSEAKPSTTSTKLVVDGIGGVATVKRMQQFFGTTQDGVISGQLVKFKSLYPSLQSVTFGSGGSACIKKLQVWCGLSDPDGYIGSNTTKGWQRKLRDLGYLAPNETIDGIFGVKSMKAMQECLNNNGKKKSTPTPKPTPTKDFKVVDVSEFQDTINWAKVKADGIKGAIIRCGFRGYESGKLQTDSMFLNHIKGAYRAKLPVGIYMFTEAKTAKEGREEADYAIKLWQTAGVPISFPIAVDTEAAGGSKDRCKNLTKAQRTEAIKGFCEQIKAKGYKPMIYASTSWLNNKLDMSKLPYDVWVAQYNTTCDYKGKYIMWQYTSEGSVDGIKGKVDMNKCYIAPKAVNPPKTVVPKSYTGSYPTQAEIKTASNNGTRAGMLKWAKDIVASGKYKYKRFTDDPKTHQCPICHPGSGNGWNCMGYAIASWKHGGNLPCKCSCGWMGDGEWDRILKMNDADALAYAQKKTGLKDVKVIRNGGKAIATKNLQAGDILGLYHGDDIQHIVLYVGDGKITDSTTGRKPNIAYGVPMYTGSQYQPKVAIRYTGGNSYMKFYDRGTGVKKIKDYLTWYDPKNKFADDDVFGTGTESAVKTFQAKEIGKGQDDGLVGQKTIDAMKKVKK